MKTAVVAITRSGARLGARLRDSRAGAELFVLRKYAGQAGKPAVVFDNLRELLAELWRSHAGIVCIMAAGIVVRLTAPLLEGKDRDPAVVVMDEGGKFAISLLSGHLGGANLLAAEVAAAVGARAVITTATDGNDLPSFDTLAQEEGWGIEELGRVKLLNSLLLDGEEIAVVDHSDGVRRRFDGRGHLSFHPNFILALQSGARGFVFVTNRRLPPQVRCDSLLVLRPRNLFLGIGCNSGTSCEEIEEVVAANLKRLFLSVASVACLASAAAKEKEEGLLEFAEAHALPLRFYSSEELNAVASPSPPSEAALAAIGAAGVAEPAALLASGGGTLLLRKVKSGNVTLSVAEKSE